MEWHVILVCTFVQEQEQGGVATVRDAARELETSRLLSLGPPSGEACAAGGDPCPTCFSASSPSTSQAAVSGASPQSGGLQGCSCGAGVVQDEALSGHTGGEPIAASGLPPGRLAVSLRKQAASCVVGEGVVASALGRSEGSKGGVVERAGRVSQERGVPLSPDMVAPEMLRVDISDQGGNGEAVSCGGAAGMMMPGANVVVGDVRALVHHQQAASSQGPLESSVHPQLHPGSQGQPHHLSESSEDRMVVDVGAEVERPATQVTPLGTVTENGAGVNGGVESSTVAKVPVVREPGGIADSVGASVCNGSGVSAGEEGMRIVVKRETMGTNGRSFPGSWVQPVSQGPTLQVQHQVASVLAGSTTSCVGGEMAQEVLGEDDTMSRLAQSLEQVRSPRQVVLF